MADFVIKVGEQKHFVPQALLGGVATVFPVGTTFVWSANDPSITFDDPRSASPAYIGVQANVPTAPTRVDLIATFNGQSFNKSHTVQVDAAVTPPTLPFDSVDFISA